MKTKPRRIIIISGTPGVGKTSVAKLLALRLDATLINLGELVVKEDLILNVDKKRGTFVADLEKTSRHLKKLFSSAAGDVVVEGHFAVHAIPAESIDRVFVLRRNPDDLRKLLKSRGWNESKIQENLASEVLDVCLYDAVKMCGDEKVCEIDVTGKTEETVVEEILSILNDNRKCWIGIVDWLGLLEREGRVDEFLGEF
ncbi:MAG: adenylate kinase family protein [Candidatus Bathyarchaeia archaeon]